MEDTTFVIQIQIISSHQVFLNMEDTAVAIQIYIMCSHKFCLNRKDTTFAIQIQIMSIHQICLNKEDNAFVILDLDHIYSPGLSKQGRHYICNIDLDHVYSPGLSKQGRHCICNIDLDHVYSPGLDLYGKCSVFPIQTDLVTRHDLDQQVIRKHQGWSIDGCMIAKMKSKVQIEDMYKSSAFQWSSNEYSYLSFTCKDRGIPYIVKPVCSFSRCIRQMQFLPYLECFFVNKQVLDLYDKCSVFFIWTDLVTRQDLDLIYISSVFLI